MYTCTGICDYFIGSCYIIFSPGMLGADTSLIGSLGDVPLTSRLALIGGTSSCHMMVSATPTIHTVHVIALFGYKYYC